MLYLFLNAVKRRLGDERGLALPLALGVTVVTSSLCAGIFSYATTNQGAAHRATADQRAYGLAEAGLSYAFSTLEKADDANPYDAPADTAVPATEVSFPDGRTFVYSGTLTGGNTWTLYGTGTVPNPSGPDGAPVVRRVSLQAEVTTTTTGDMRPYNYLFIDQPSGCFTITNTVTITIPLYVRGNLCLENNSLIQAPAVHILGNVHVNSPQASVGTSANPIPDFSIEGYCYRNTSLTPCNASATSRVWAGAYGTSPPAITKPTIDLPKWYAEAPLGPANQGNCPGFFDNDSTLNVSRAQVNLTPSTAYDCYVGPVGDPTAQIKWVPGQNPSKPGTLTVRGTIYFDADLMWENLSLVQYDGLATIYTSGKVTLKNQTDVCGVEACDSSWDHETDFITLVVGSKTSATETTPDSVLIDNFTTFQGAIVAANDYTQGNNTTIWGPVIARNGNLSNSSLLKPLPGPPGTLVNVPSDTVTVSEIRLVPGSYSG